jgi:biopolymer transport protein ExbD
MAIKPSQGAGNREMSDVNTTPLIDVMLVMLVEESGKNPQPQIQLRPSALASYDVVANVMASAQRNNMTRMGFTNVAEFAD